MFLPSFRHLIEIEALKKQNQQNFAQISSENKRICDLEERREKTKIKISDIDLEIKSFKLGQSLDKINTLETRLKKLNSQLNLAVTEKEQLAFENQIASSKKELAAEEEIYFANLEKAETLQEEIKSLQQFLEGSIKSLEEIKNEVLQNVAKEQLSIDNRKLRINALLENLHPSLKTLYAELEKKFQPRSPVSYLIEKKCTECHIQVDSMLKNSLEEGRSIETCPSCGRLLIPETAKIY